jgi:hypothetical protein
VLFFCGMLVVIFGAIFGIIKLISAL